MSDQPPLATEFRDVIRQLHDEAAHPGHHLSVHPDTWIALAGTAARPAGAEDDIIACQETIVPPGEWQLVDVGTGDIHSSGPVFAQ